MLARHVHGDWVIKIKKKSNFCMNTVHMINTELFFFLHIILYVVQKQSSTPQKINIPAKATEFGDLIFFFSKLVGSDDW